MIRTKEQVFEAVKIQAVLNGGVCLSDEYKDVFTPLKFRCASKHEFELAAEKILPREYIKNGKKIVSKRWCPKCRLMQGQYISYKDINKKYKSIAQEYAEQKGFILVSKKCNGYDDKIFFKCDKGHSFHKRIKDIRSYLKTGKGPCPYCLKKQYSIEDLRSLAVKHKGECLSNKYISWRNPYLWQCKNGHIFTRRWRDMLKVKDFCFWCKLDRGYWRLPNKTHENKIMDYAEKHGINLEDYYWNKTSKT